MPYVMCGNISVLYNMVFMHRGNTYFNLFKTPIFFEHLFATFWVCFFQFKFVSNAKKAYCVNESPICNPTCVTHGGIRYGALSSQRSHSNA